MEPATLKASNLDKIDLVAFDRLGQQIGSFFGELEALVKAGTSDPKLDEEWLAFLKTVDLENVQFGCALVKFTQRPGFEIFRGNHLETIFRECESLVLAFGHWSTARNGFNAAVEAKKKAENGEDAVVLMEASRTWMNARGFASTKGREALKLMSSWYDIAVSVKVAL